MTTPSPERTTRLLNRFTEGDRTVSDDLVEHIHAELRKLARGYMAREGSGHTLQPTALVNEAFLRLVDVEGVSWKSRNHFYAVASKVMRRILVDHARERQAQKRGGNLTQVPLDEEGPSGDVEGLDVLDVHEALEELASIDPALVEVVELRHFGGLTVPRIGETLEVSGRTVERRLRAASLWLEKRLG